LVPFKNSHFLISGFAPLTSPASSAYRRTSIIDLTQQMISKENVTITCNPLNPGDPKEGKPKSRFLASFAAFRGNNVPSSEVDRVLHSMQASGSRFDKFFPDWIPNCISASICTKSHHEYKPQCVTFASNNTAIHEVFDYMIDSWDKMYKSRSYLHVFEQDGIHQQDMMESRNLLEYISDQYKEFARWEDKFFEEGKFGPDGRPIEKKEAIQNADQDNIVAELRDLRDTYIKSGKDR